MSLFTVANLAIMFSCFKNPPLCIFTKIKAVRMVRPLPSSLDIHLSVCLLLVSVLCQDSHTLAAFSVCDTFFPLPHSSLKSQLICLFFYFIILSELSLPWETCHSLLCASRIPYRTSPFFPNCFIFLTWSSLAILKVETRSFLMFIFPSCGKKLKKKKISL